MHIPYTRFQLMNLIEGLFHQSKKYIVAQEMFEYHKNGRTLVSSELRQIKDATGKMPAMLGMDAALALGHYSPEEIDTIVQDLTAFAESGGIITICAHFKNPLHPEKYNYRGHLGRDDAWEALLTEGTPTNIVFTEDLRQVAGFLKRLDDAGIPVLWRPLHEMNGNWFWFCVCQDEGYIIPRIYAERLWRYIYKICMEEFGMKHLIWVYSPHIGADDDIMYCYPGDDVVDLVAMDWYTQGRNEIFSDWGKGKYAALASTGKPFGLAEFGATGDALTDLDISPEYKFNCEDSLNIFDRMHREGMPFAWVMFWASWRKVKISLWNMGKGDMLMHSPNVMDLEKVRAYWDGKTL